MIRDKKIQGMLPIEFLMYFAVVMAVIVGLCTFFSEKSKANELDKIKYEIETFNSNSKKGDKLAVLLTDTKQSINFCSGILVGDTTKGISSVKVNDTVITGFENNEIRKVCIKEREKDLVKIELTK